MAIESRNFFLLIEKFFLSQEIFFANMKVMENNSKKKIRDVLIIIGAIAGILAFSKLLELLYSLFFSWIL